jgi:choline dehydrogenase-like flavoprotein
MLGGTSGMNFMVWNRGSRQDYDSWKELGNPGWDWDSIKYYLQKSESFKAPPEAQQKEFVTPHKPSDHGMGGPVQTTYQPFFAETHKYWHRTLEKLNVDTNKAHFGGSNTGAWTTVANVDPKTQIRSYSARAYLLPIAHRQNLKVLTNAQVDEIILEPHDDGTGEVLATGVKFTSRGRKFVSKCTREVVLSAGSVGSPQILELSGIGNPDTLDKAGIETRVANPNVGENLQEHLMTMTVYELAPEIVTPEDYANPDFEREADELYRTAKTGMRTSTPGSMAYVPVSQFVEDTTSLRQVAQKYATAHPRPSRDFVLNTVLQRQFSPQAKLGQVEFIFDHSNYSPLFQSEPGKKYASMMQILQYPYSRGSIHIDPAAAASGKVLIDPKYYQGEGAIDYEVMAQAQKFGDRICRTAPLSDIIVKRVYPPEKPDVDWHAWVGPNTITDWHPVGTCSMLPRSSGGVVDPTLKVYGTANVRVADASIFPLHISAHIQATVYAVAEKAADLIKETWDTPLRARL